MKRKPKAKVAAVVIGSIEATAPQQDESRSPFVNQMLALKPEQSFVVKGISYERLTYRLKWLRQNKGIRACIIHTQVPGSFRICLKQQPKSRLAASLNLAAAQ